MRNIFKRSERGTRTRRTNHGVSAVVAALASASLVAGLAAYPAEAQDETALETLSAEALFTPDEASSLAEDSIPETTPTPASPQVPTTSAQPIQPPLFTAGEAVQVTRDEDVDVVVVNDPDGKAWGYGAKASDENIFGITRSGDGEIEKITGVTIDGVALDSTDYGFVNNADGGVLAFDMDALHEIPPQHVELKVRTTGPADYKIAESDEVPTVEELEASGFGAADDDAPQADLNMRASDETFWSAEQRLDSPIIGAGTQVFEGLTGSKRYIEVKPTGAFPGQDGPDIRITRIVVRNIQTGTQKPDLQWAVEKNANEKYYGKGSAVKDNQGRDKGVEIRFFDPESGNSPINGQFLIWSGSDNLKIASNINYPGWSSNIDVLRNNYEVEVYGSFRVKDERKEQSWSEDNDQGKLSTTAKPIVSVRENRWKAEMVQKVTKGGILTPSITAEIPKGTTAYSPDSGVQPRLTIAGPDGSVIAEYSGRVLDGKASFGLPDPLAIPDGATLTVRMELKGDNAKRAEVPQGPGNIDFSVEPEDNGTVPGPGGKFTEPEHLEDPSAAKTGGSLRFETVTTTPAGRAYFKVDGGPVTLESITLSNSGQNLEKDPSGAGFEILANACREVPSNQVTSCQRYVWFDGQQVTVNKNQDGSLTYKFKDPYTFGEGQRFALPFAGGKLNSDWKISGSTPEAAGPSQPKESDLEGQEPVQPELPDATASAFSIPETGGSKGICLPATNPPIGLGAKPDDRPTLVQFNVENSSTYRDGSLHLKRTDGKVFKQHTVVYEFTNSRNSQAGTSSIRSQVVRGWGTSEIVIDLREIVKIYEANGWTWPAGFAYMNVWLNDDLPCGNIQTAIYKQQIGAEPANKGQRVCKGETLTPEKRHAPIAAANPGGVYVIASNIDRLPPGANNDLNYRYSSQLYLQENGSSQFVEVGNETPWVYNALSYNPQDNWLYAISQPRGHDTNKRLTYLEDPCYPAGHLLQINPRTGEVHDLGKVKKPASGKTHSMNTDYGFQGSYRHSSTPATSANDLWGGINSGVFDNQNRYWVSNSSSSGTGAMYLVNLDNPSAEMYGSEKNGSAPSISTDRYRTFSEDLAAMPASAHPNAQRYLWGIRSPWISPAGEKNKIFLERIDLETGEVRTTNIADLMDPVTGVKLSQLARNGAPVWGKAWSYGNGDLGFGTGGRTATTDSIRLRVLNPGTESEKVELISHGTAPRSYNTDGASTIAARNVDLGVKKTRSETWIDGKQTKVSWVVTVTNESYGPSSGFELNDLLPDTVKNPVVTAVVGSDATWKVQWGPQDNKQLMRFTHGYLGPRSSVEIHLSADVAGKPEEAVCSPNFATLTPNEIDLKTDNNSAVDAPCVDKKPGEVSGPDENGSYSANYTIQITNPLRQKTEVGGVTRPAADMHYGPVIDTLHFPKGIEVQEVSWTGIDENEKQFVSTTAQQPLNQEDLRFELAKGGTIKKDGKRNLHQYHVQVKYLVTDAKALSTAVDPETCAPGKSLYNNVNVQGAEDIACVPPPETNPAKVSLHLAKVSSDDFNGDDILTNGKTLSRAKFELVPLGDDWEPIQGQKSLPFSYNEERGTFGSPELEPGKYRLYERQAPEGFSLLTRPIDFSVGIVGNSGSAQVALRFADASVVARQIDLSKAPSSWGLTDRDAILTLANVRQGNLPKTGGYGLQVPLLLSSVLILFGTALGRRNMTRA